MSGRIGIVLGLAAIATGLALSARAEPSGFDFVKGRRHRVAGMVVVPAGENEVRFANAFEATLRAAGLTDVNVTAGRVTTFSGILPPATVGGRMAAEIPFAPGNAPIRVTSVEPV